MSRLGGKDATPATRRSARISQAGSVTGQSIVTTMTTNGTKSRKRGPLAKVTSRKSNTYGSSGRVGAAEALTLSATGFAQAFQDQRGGAVARDDDDDDEEDDDVDELGAETPRMSGALNGYHRGGSASLEPESPAQEAPRMLFEESDGITPSENDFPMSIGDTSKSFGPDHEAGMLARPSRMVPSRMDPSRSPSENRHTPLWEKNMRRRQQNHPNQGLPGPPLAEYQEEEEVEVEVQAEVQVVAEERRTRPAPASPARKAAIGQPANGVISSEQEHIRREGPPAPRGRSRQAPAQRLDDPQVVDEWHGNVEPDVKDENEWNWKKYITTAFWCILAFLVASQALRSIMSSKFPESGPTMASAVASRVAYQWDRLANFIQPPGGKTEQQEVDAFRAGDDNIMWNRLYKLNNKFDAEINSLNNTIKEFKHELPEFMIVRRHADGRREITDDFWHALIGKAHSKGSDPVWIDYLKSNEQKLRDFFGKSFDVDGASHWPEAVSRQEFVDTMSVHYKSIAAQVDEKISDAIKGQAAQIKSIAQAEVRQATVDSIRLRALAESNLVANYELTYRKTNYFSSGLGAHIVPTLTSATFLDNPRWYSRLARRVALVPLRNPPKSAMEKWEEPGDCWCAAPNPSMKGQSQLAVSLASSIFPEQVTIEHLPKDMMPGKKITNAPRTLEFWVETDQPAQYQYAHREGVCGSGPAGWTCLGSFTYNIHASNHQQTFDLDAQTSVPITKAMVRVTSNWGADHTCLYRVRLHGRDAVAEHQYNVRLNDPAE
ncbi:hypothetical protein CC86DRAFT_187433 [Ophiobolus disseminans]|uniref:SUN domain-containing protein n=1 Tax=Ophiobolus disseminans TaxID=1469910 RepID=A0A6A7A7J8_9PLEO|nr:hypothetical protein CC86DRAFT_187433 [Ophiobolus disseminans]